MLCNFFFSPKLEVCVVGLQFDGSDKSPDFGNTVISPFAQLLGNTLVFNEMLSMV